MEEENILEEIDRLFKKENCPDGNEKRLASWHEAMKSVPLFQLEYKILVDALFHIMPTVYGDVELFKYLLSLCLRISFFPERTLYERDDFERHEIRGRTGWLCCQWKQNLKESEIDLIDRVFWSGLQQDYGRTGNISPFYFNLFVLWQKSPPEFIRLGESAKLAIDEFKNKGKQVIQGYLGIEEKYHSFKALFNCYLEVDKKPVRFQSVIDQWNEEVLCAPFMTMWEIFGRDRMADIEEQLREYFSC